MHVRIRPIISPEPDKTQYCFSVLRSARNPCKHRSFLPKSQKDWIKAGISPKKPVRFDLGNTYLYLQESEEAELYLGEGRTKCKEKSFHFSRASVYPGPRSSPHMTISKKRSSMNAAAVLSYVLP